MSDSLLALLTGELPPRLYRCSSRMRATTISRLAARHGWQSYWLDGRAIAGKATFLNRAAEVLRFPPYFGHNWDAFEECLNDTSWATGKPALLLFDHAGCFAVGEPEQFAVALDILAAAARSRQGDAAPLVVLVRGAGRGAAHLPVV